MESCNGNHATILTVRPDNDGPGNEPFHITLQRRVSLLTNRNTARFYLIRKNQAVIVERTRLRRNARGRRIWKSDTHQKSVSPIMVIV